MQTINNASESMATSSQVINQLREKGIQHEFRFDGSGLSINNERSYPAEELRIAKIYRFEGDSNPSDMEVIYVIKTKDGHIGFTHEVYGTYANEEDQLTYNNFMRQVVETGHDEQLLFEL